MYFSVILHIFIENIRPKGKGGDPYAHPSAYVSVHSQLTDYFMSINLFFKQQHGFLSGYSTLTNLLDCLNNWTTAMNNKNGVHVTYIYMVKAYTPCYI